ncbi:flavodoxin [Alkalibaculum sp. M08DMB]|uniref:Flavodoxin n=1 Tax=Alkalibaculum sporogenes TaxID=2655001 RepID=A0A6A7K812_9FIRM|nr:flavodoxin domain-containing protein [Alkalibaculum sporogenes]MPW25502.1 flavodoxin [Alkalibaculum sporogenes]
MNTLIVYASKYGCTEKCANLVKKGLNDQVDLINLKEVNDIDLSKYSKVIIGGSIYVGKIQKIVSDFCSKYLDELLEKRVGLFICAMQEADIIDKQLNENFPLELTEKAEIKEWLGGEFLLDKMSFIDKMIVKKVSKVTTNTTNILVDKINGFVKIMN